MKKTTTTTTATTKRTEQNKNKNILMIALSMPLVGRKSDIQFFLNSNLHV